MLFCYREVNSPYLAPLCGRWWINWVIYRQVTAQRLSNQLWHIDQSASRWLISVTQYTMYVIVRQSHKTKLSSTYANFWLSKIRHDLLIIDQSWLYFLSSDRTVSKKNPLLLSDIIDTDHDWYSRRYGGYQ